MATNMVHPKSTNNIDQNINNNNNTTNNNNNTPAIVNTMDIENLNTSTPISPEPMEQGKIHIISYYKSQYVSSFICLTSRSIDLL